MQVDYAVELGAEDPTLEIPWAAADGSARYYDLKAHPELLLYVEEATRQRDLGEFLESVNSRRSSWQTAKCDAWFSNELSEEEQIFGATCKFGSYTDLFFTSASDRASFEAHEEWAKRLTQLLKQVPEIAASAEFIIRRCYYHSDDPQSGDMLSGFYLTCYAFGYGDDEEEAHRRWGIALKLLENAILQLSASQPA